MIPVTLPRKPDRDWLLAFWIALGLTAGAAAGAAAWILGWPAARAGLAAAIVAAAILVPGLVRPELAIRPYEIWNRAARAYARRARGPLLAICYYTLVLAARRRRGGRLRARRPTPGASGWIARGTLEPERYPALDAVGGPPPRGSLRDLADWAARSEHPWVAFLLPTLAVLRGLKVGPPPAASEIYTLY